MIPRTAHFVWFGREFPWVHALAVRSAAKRGGFEHVVLHHEEGIAGGTVWAELCENPHIETRLLHPEVLFAQLGYLHQPLLQLYRRLAQPAAKANVIRAALLAVEGGVYLDTDTVTVSSFAPLLDTGCFCGLERIALPLQIMCSRNPITWLKTLCRLAARDICRRLPSGWRWFRKIERIYPLAVNNAVLGAEAGHPFVMNLLKAMVELPERRQLVRFALGTQLLEERVAAETRDDLALHGTAKFYPLCPEISEHWFRLQKNPRLNEALSPEAVTVHWYASVRTKRLVPLINPHYIRQNEHHQLFSALAAQFL